LGNTLREGTNLDIESELNLIKETRRELKANCSSEKAERRTMKELGLKRSDTKNLFYHKNRRKNFVINNSNLTCVFSYAQMNEGLGSLGGQTLMFSPRQWERCCWGTFEVTFRWSFSGRAS
jgi:hypothetical protein